jgi:hypothetical protein
MSPCITVGATHPSYAAEMSFCDPIKLPRVRTNLSACPAYEQATAAARPPSMPAAMAPFVSQKNGPASIFTTVGSHISPTGCGHLTNPGCPWDLEEGRLCTDRMQSLLPALLNYRCPCHGWPAAPPECVIFLGFLRFALCLNGFGSRDVGWSAGAANCHSGNGHLRQFGGVRREGIPVDVLAAALFLAMPVPTSRPLNGMQLICELFASQNLIM